MKYCGGGQKRVKRDKDGKSEKQTDWKKTAQDDSRYQVGGKLSSIP